MEATKNEYVQRLFNGIDGSAWAGIRAALPEDASVTHVTKVMRGIINHALAHANDQDSPHAVAQNLGLAADAMDVLSRTAADEASAHFDRAVERGEYKSPFHFWQTHERPHDEYFRGAVRVSVRRTAMIGSIARDVAPFLRVGKLDEWFADACLDAIKSDKASGPDEVHAHTRQEIWSTFCSAYAEAGNFAQERMRGKVRELLEQQPPPMNMAEMAVVALSAGGPDKGAGRYAACADLAEVLGHGLIRYLTRQHRDVLSMLYMACEEAAAALLPKKPV